MRRYRRHRDISTWHCCHGAVSDFGLDPYLNVITAQTTLLLSDQQTLVTLRVSEMTAAVQLIQSLGGGWDITQLPTPEQVNSKDAVKTP